MSFVLDTGVVNDEYELEYIWTGDERVDWTLLRGQMQRSQQGSYVLNEAGGSTEVGADCFLMTGCHVAHDCRLGNDIVMANNATLGGHVTVGDFAVFGGLCAVHQRCRIGRGAMIGGVTGVEQDVIPYGMVLGDRARLGGLNVLGMQRLGFTASDVHSVRQAYKLLFGEEGTFAERVTLAAERFGEVKLVMEIVDFIRADSTRRIVQPLAGNGG